ncbi:hypothetical protein ES705_18418 [subsurface metagenome]
MNIKKDLKISNKWLSIVFIFAICISVVSISGIFSHVLNNKSNISNQNENNLKTPRAAVYNTKLFITTINQSHTVRGSNFTKNFSK